MGVAAEPLSRPAPSRLTPHRALGDGALVRLVSKGDERAFEALYHRYRDQLHRYCASILRQSQDAEEALQATMLNAYRALLNGERDVAVKPWLYRIAHNQCISLMRRRSHHEELSGLEESPGGRVEEQAEVSEDLRQLRADLAQLPHQQRSALVLRELSGLSHDAIAQTLDTTPAGAKQLIYEARQTLQEFGEGRSLSCSEVRQRVSDGDGRLLRARRVKAHLRACAGCTRFQASVLERPTRLAALAPVLPALAAQRILETVLASVAGGHGAAVLASAAAGGGTGAGAWMTTIGGVTEGAGAGGAAAGAVGGGTAAAGSGAALGGATAGAAAAGGGAAGGLSVAAGASAGVGLSGFAMKAAVVGAVALVGGSAAVVPLARQALRASADSSAAAADRSGAAPAAGSMVPSLLTAAADPTAATGQSATPGAGAASDPASPAALGPPIGTVDPSLIAMAAADPLASASPVSPAPAGLGDVGSTLAAATADAAAGAAGQLGKGATLPSAQAATGGTAAGAAAGTPPSSAGGASRPPSGATIPQGTASSSTPMQPSVGSTSLASVVRSLSNTVKIPLVSGVVGTILPGASEPTSSQSAPATSGPATQDPATGTSSSAAGEPATAPTDSGTSATGTSSSSPVQVGLPDPAGIVSSLNAALTPLLTGLANVAAAPSEADVGAPTSTAPAADGVPAPTP